MIKTERTIRTSFLFYKKNIEKPKDSKTYIAIANGYMQFIMDQVTEGHEVVLPAKMGSLEIVGRRGTIKINPETGLRSLPPNWPATKALWAINSQAKVERKIVYHLNEESSGLIYKVHWSKRNILVENKRLYSLRIARTPKRVISQAIKLGKEYIIQKTQYNG
jgi:hypothetical protein